MSTAYTQTNSEQRAVSISEFIQTHYVDVVPDLVNSKYSFVAFQVISCGIEFLGICISNHDFVTSKQSQSDFDLALEKFPSLHKYSKLTIVQDSTVPGNRELYGALRCGVIHDSRPKKGLMLSEKNNVLPAIIGLDNFSSDFIAACEYLLTSSISLGGGKSLSDTFCYVNDEQ